MLMNLNLKSTSVSYRFPLIKYLLNPEVSLVGFDVFDINGNTSIFFSTRSHLELTEIYP